jgi:glutaredoxin
MNTAPPARRCAQHDLATGPDGRCTLCHRAALPIALQAREGQQRPDLLTWLFGFGLVVSVAALAWLTVAHRSVAAVQRPASVAPPPEPQRTAAEPKPKPVEPAQTDEPAAAPEPASDTETEPERATSNVAKPSAISAEELARRERERQEQDRRRHEAVARDLQQQSLKAARRNVSITMYSTSWCGVCKSARSYMLSQNIPFTELDVEQDASARARAAALNPRGSVPTIAIDNEVLIGFSAGSLEDRIARAARKRAGS